MLVDTWAAKPDSRLNVSRGGTAADGDCLVIYFFIIYLSSSAFQNGPETAANLMVHLLYSLAWGCSRQTCFCLFPHLQFPSLGFISSHVCLQRHSCQRLEAPEAAAQEGLALISLAFYQL